MLFRSEVGQNVYRHAQAMLSEAQSAREAVDRLSVEPRGLIKVSAPVALAQQQLAELLPDFLMRYPQVRVQMQVSNRRVDLINEGFDVALRVRSQLNDDGSLVMRSFGQIRELLVASPSYLDARGRPATPQDLAGHLTLSMSEDESRQRWELHGPDDVTARVDIQPRLMGHDFPLLMESAKRGLGIALLPETVCGDLIHQGVLELVLPDWSLPQGICHAVFPSRRGLLPSVRVFIDFLAERLPPLLETSRTCCNKARAEHATPVAATV